MTPCRILQLPPNRKWVPSGSSTQELMLQPWKLCSPPEIATNKSCTSTTSQYIVPDQTIFFGPLPYSSLKILLQNPSPKFVSLNLLDQILLKLATKTLILEAASARIFFSKKYNKESSSLSNVYAVMISKECKMEENIGTTLLISSLTTCTTKTRRREGGRAGKGMGRRQEGRKEGRSSTRVSRE